MVVGLHKYELLEIIGRYRHCFSMSCNMRSRFEKFHHIFNSKYKSFAAMGSVTGCNMTPACSFARTPALSE